MRTKRAFEVKYKISLIIFKGLSVAKNCLTCEKAPLNGLENLVFDKYSSLKLMFLSSFWISFRSLAAFYFIDCRPQQEVLACGMVILLYASLVWCWCWLFAQLKKSPKVPGSLLLRQLRRRCQFCICNILWNGSNFSSLNWGSVKANWLLNLIILIAFLCNLMTSFIIWFYDLAPYLRAKWKMWNKKCIVYSDQ